MGEKGPDNKTGDQKEIYRRQDKERTQGCHLDMQTWKQGI